MILRNKILNLFGGDMSFNTECPVCGNDFEVDETTVVGELMDCDDCGTELEVKGLNPVRVEEAPQVEEDWGE